jgi:hypothetical protein
MFVANPRRDLATGDVRLGSAQVHAPVRGHARLRTCAMARLKAYGTPTLSGARRDSLPTVLRAACRLR